MASKRKFKRDYIILEAKDTNFRYKERILPKAFAKVEISEEKSIVSLYVENLKSVKDGYKVVAIKSDYETLDLGRVAVSEQGKGEFVLNLEKDDIEVKGIALLHERSVPLIGFKGSKIENYEEILFTNDSYEGENEDEYEEYEEYEEIEYIEVEDGEDLDDEYEEYEEIEYIEIDEDDESEEDGYEEIQEYEEIDNMEYLDTAKEMNKRNNKYQEYDNVEEAIARNMVKSKEAQSKSKNSSQQRPSVNQNTQYQYDKQTNKNSTEKSAGALLMPRQIKKGLKYFNEVKPFVSEDIEDTRWWKIEITPATLCGYTMPYLGYVNSLNYTMYSDIVMNSYKYRHYLFGVQYDEYNKRKNYVYAIPGNKEDQPDKGHTGFTTYQACDTRDDKLGYWICFIDSRTRRIIK